MHANETIESCAARELVEESCGTILSVVDKHVFVRALTEQQYVLRLETAEDVVFVVRFAWRPSVVFEFAQVAMKLRAVSRVSRGVALGSEERLLLCRFRWLQSHSDPSLQTLLKHPAVIVRKQILPVSAVQQASNALSESIGSVSRQVDMLMPTSCLVIDGVRGCWLEKDRIDLFSLQQMQQVLRPLGLASGAGQTLDFEPGFLAVFRTLFRAIVTGRLTCRKDEVEA